MKRTALRTAIQLLAVLVTAAVGAATPRQDEASVVAVHLQRIGHPLNGARTQFGSSVDAQGPTLIAGAPANSWQHERIGAAYVFEQQGAAWPFQAELLSSDVEVSDAFGADVAISGERAAVGAPDKANVASMAGAVYVFERAGGAWAQEAKLVAPDPDLGARLGHAVSLDGDTLVAGAPNDDGVSTGEGSAYVFTRSGGAWSLLQKLEPSGPQSIEFGYALDLEGDTLVVGTRYGSPGHVHVFERVAGAWVETFVIEEVTNGAMFGTAVDLDGDQLAVGASHEGHGGHPSAGAVYVYERDGAAWVRTARIERDVVADADLFGLDVALQGDRLVVARQLPARPDVFRRRSTGWRQEAALWNSPSEPWGYGQALALSGDLVFCGDARDSLEEPLAGAVNVSLIELAFEATCFGDGSAGPCLCGNESAPGSEEGCANSTGAGARLAGAGTSRVSAGDLRLEGSGLVPHQPALLVASLDLGQVPYGNGLRCLGGDLFRLAVETGGAGGTATWSGSGASVVPEPGMRWHYQAFYRDPAAAACGATWNTSPAVSVLFGP